MNQHADDAYIGMDKKEIRRMLLLAGGQKLRAAVALNADGKAVIVLDRHKQPRALERELKEQLPGSRLHRFGTFAADEDDRKLARFVLNRAAPGMARKLVKALRGTGLRRVEIGLEDGSAAEAAEEVDGEEDVAVYDPAQRQAEAAAHARHVELSRQLLLLVEQVARVSGADHDLRSRLLGLAETAQADLKRERLREAAAGIAALSSALSDRPPPMG